MNTHKNLWSLIEIIWKFIQFLSGLVEVSENIPKLIDILLASWAFFNSVAFDILEIDITVNVVLANSIKIGRTIHAPPIITIAIWGVISMWLLKKHAEK